MYWFIFCNDLLALRRTDTEGYTIPQGEMPPVELKFGEDVHRITPMSDGTEVRTVSMSPKAQMEHNLPNDLELCALRASYYKLPEELYLKAGKCAEIVYWDRNTQYCGRCGSPMQKHTDISKRCPQCGKEVWPNLSVAVITLVSRGDEALLVHARNFRGNFYGLIAGFVETGETLEEAAEREIMEETGIRVRNIRYFASQPWPFPSGLMVGFNADYESGDVRLQKSELSSGDWFDRHNLPQLPEKLSIARRLIDNWLKEKETE